MEFKNYIAFTHDKNGKRTLVEIVTPETKTALEKRISNSNASDTDCYGVTKIIPRYKVTLKAARNYLKESDII